ncbi:choice-of-anchor A family protein [Sphingosinicellaceae bacterium]|nr:choice-of-anchor A family protein [Sphingosinicellaceae bacterium]
MNYVNRVALAALLVSAAMPAGAVTGNARDALKSMQALNLIVLQDYNASADVEGKTYVGGNLNGNASLGIGASANPGQTNIDNGFHSTIAVGGSVNGQINLNNGVGVGNNYGAYVAGSINAINLNASGATIHAGSLSNNINIGNNNKIYVAGDVHGISAGTGNTIRIGGNATSGNYNFNSGSSLEIVGSIANLGLGAGTTNKVGGSVSNVNGTSGAALYVHGGISGNANTNGATFAQNYAFSAGNPAPAAPVVASLSATTAQMTADVGALSVSLAALASGATLSTITYGSQGPTFHAVDGGNGYAVFNVSEAIFGYGELNYDFANAALPVIINVINSNAAVHAAMTATYNWNLNPVGGANGSASQQVIWNFTDASNLNLNTAVYGSILAPHATVANNGPINGSVVAKIFNQSGEVHLGTYARDVRIIPDGADEVPEPAVWAQMIVGFGLAGAVLRRRRNYSAIITNP